MEQINMTWFWIGFNLFVLLMLALDLGVFHRKAHEVKFKEALTWTGIWVILALCFNALIHFWFGKQAGLEFLTGYLIEKSLSVDNVFVFLLIFTYFKIPAKYQHEVLFWGILGALIMRVAFIFAGITLLKQFHWLIYIFGGFLIFTGIKLAFEKTKEIHPENNPIIKLFKRIVPTTHEFHEGKFFIKQDGKLWATPLFVALLVVELTDVIFAVDSIPAILAITQDPFIVYTSNVFAILGLRSLYFAIAGLMSKFHHLHFGLAGILCFVGIKMLLSETFKIPTFISLTVIASFLILSIVASIIWPQKTPEQSRPI